MSSKAECGHDAFTTTPDSVMRCAVITCENFFGKNKPPPRWDELFPYGRVIFYEGDDPDGFVKEIKSVFDFDPSEDPRWNDQSMAEGSCYAFLCPAILLDCIYGNDMYLMGS